MNTTPHHPLGPRPGVILLSRSLSREALSTVRSGGFRLLGIMLAFDVAAFVLLFPLFRWLFKQALRANGMAALDLGALEIGTGFPLTVALIILICVLALWVVSLQFATVVLVLRRSRAGMTLTVRDVLSDLAGVAKKLARPSSFPLLGYLFFMLPVSGFGFTTVLAQGITIPSFITGELYKSPLSATILIAFLVILAYVNLRYALAIPAFTLTNATGGRAFRISWRLTRDRSLLSFILTTLLLLLCISTAATLLIVIALVPTALTDAFAPGASPLVAAYSLGAAQVIGAIIGALATSFLAALLIAFFDEQSHRLPIDAQPRELTPGHRAHLSPRSAASFVITVCVIATLILGTLATGTMQRLSNEPSTLVLGHRGFSGGGVENTLSGLDAAKAAGADMVEMDVMQTADGKFVAMHDASLSRLAGIDANVKDLTLEELTSITVSDSYGHSDRIPSFAEYVEHANDIGMPLLIEIKLNGGGETPDHVERMIAELDELGLTEANIYHTLDKPSLDTLKQIRPDLTVGYTMAFGGVGAPETVADFVVVEEWTATQKLQDQVAAAGLGFWSWTVNDEQGMRELLRRDVDGIITDHPDQAVALREEIQESSGLAGTLFDALARFVKIA